MADETTPAETTAKKTKLTAIEIFCRRSGYQPSDVVAHNEKTKVFVTSNGGKYQLVSSGVRRLSGPDIPKKEG